jgi:predicted transcriptional regulator
MRSVTLKLPDDLATALEAMPEDERNHFATAALTAAIEDDEEADPDLIAALQAGIAEMEAGNVLTLDEMDASFREREARVLAKLGR